MKFCRDCKYYEKYNMICQSPQNPVCVVTGNVTQQNPYRSRENEKLCGPQGLFWHKKDNLGTLGVEE
jgi:hypothetical protein